MKSIPAEILIYIFRLLHQQDKLQCMTVCREWESVIKSAVLFETLSISTKRGLDSVLSSVRREPSHGTQTKRLIIQMNPGEDFDTSILPNLFPNVTGFYINPSVTVQQEDLELWHNKLKHYFGGDPLNNPYLFKSEMWANLTNLEIRGDGSETDAKVFLDTLQNTPAVKHLKLRAMRFEMHDFEFIHDTLPSLKSLLLINVNYTSNDPLRDIVPAPSVTSFSVTDSCLTHLESRAMLFLYILQKYPNLSELAIGISTDQDYPYARFNNTYFLRDEWNELLMSLSPRLQKIHLQLRIPGEYNYVLEALDRSNCQLQSLILDGFLFDGTVDILPDLNQARYLQSLTIINSVERINQRLSSMKMLTELHLHHKDEISFKSYEFSELLLMCGENLESLRITGILIRCPFITNTTTLPVLHQTKSLELVNIFIPPVIGTFISWSFPQLHTLKLRDCLSPLRGNHDDMQEDICIMLPNINLHYLEIIDHFQPDYYILLVTLSNGQKRLLTTKSGRKEDLDVIEEGFGLRDGSIFPPPMSLEYGKKPVSPIATIVCNSVKDIFLSGI